MQRNKRNGHYESAELEQKIYYQVMTLPFYFNIHPKHIPLSSHYLVLVEVNNFILGTSKCIKHSPLGSHYLPTSFFAFFEKIPILVFVFLFEAPKSHNLTHYSLLILFGLNQWEICQLAHMLYHDIVLYQYSSSNQCSHPLAIATTLWSLVQLFLGPRGLLKLQALIICRCCLLPLTIILHD